MSESPTEKRELRLHQLAEDFRRVTAQPGGRRLLWWLLHDVCRIESSGFTGNSETYRNLGRREVGLEIKKKWRRADLSTWQTAERENPDITDTERPANHESSRRRHQADG